MADNSGSPHMHPEDGVERLKHTLYSRKDAQKPIQDIRTPLSEREEDVPLSWKKEETVEPKRMPLLSELVPKKPRLSLAAKFLIGSALFFILAAGAAAYMFFAGGNLISPENIDLEIVAPSLVDSGKQADLQILITNRNASPLTLVDLVLDYPDGTRDPSDPSVALTHQRISIGSIAVGENLKRTASALVFGSEGTTEKISAHLEYSIKGSNAVFQKDADANMVIGSSPVSVSLKAPAEATAGETFSMDITVANNTEKPLAGVVLQAQYPFGYSYQSAQPSAIAGGTFWRLGTLGPGTSQLVRVTGSVQGQDNDTRVFKFIAGTNADQTDTTVKVPLLTVPQTMTVHKPFISGQISINGQSGKTVSVTAGQPISGTITWQNNLPTAVSDVQLTLFFSGAALDQSAISSATGFYQSGTKSITWTKEQEPELAQVAPGQSGTLQFSFASLPPGANNTLITNPTIGLNLNVSGTRAGESGVPEQISSAASARVSFASVATLTAQAQHFTGAITNTGPIPPKVESDTSYTIVLSVKNSSNTIANASVTTALPPYVRYVSTGASGVSYDSASRTVTWTIGDINGGVGYTSAAKQASFQLILTPSDSQVGSAPQLTGGITLQGQDRFAQVGVTTTVQPLTTALSETGFTPGMDIVAPKQ